MPELPEVETTLRGIEPYLINQRIAGLTVRNRHLRWPVDAQLERKVQGQIVTALRRRGKYILISLEQGHLIVHLGMSGSIRVLTPDIAPQKHDHVDLLTAAGRVIRYRDPRRFGAWLWTQQNPEQHVRITNLGVEPLQSEFNSEYLYQQSRKRRVKIKTLIMDGSIVTGVGNIYASEALFRAGVRPGRGCYRVNFAACQRLVDSIKLVLDDAIAKGGTTLQDFTAIDGKPGYFRQMLLVYGREKQTCYECGARIRKVVIGQRASFYCPDCQQ